MLERTRKGSCVFIGSVASAAYALTWLFPHTFFLQDSEGKYLAAGCAAAFASVLLYAPALLSFIALWCLYEINATEVMGVTAFASDYSAVIFASCVAALRHVLIR